MTQAPAIQHASEPSANQDAMRERILSAALELLAREGESALTTRAVAAAAGIQPPTLYRHFSDKSRLLDAVAEYGFAQYLAEKQVREHGLDLVHNLRRGWDLNVEFGLSHPAVFALMSGNRRAGKPSPAAAAGAQHLKKQMSALALAGRLRISEDRATDLMRAASLGIVLTLLETPEAGRDSGLSVVAREAVLAALLTDASNVESSASAQAVITLRAALPDVTVLSAGEKALMNEWLERLSTS
ncbi:TetR/AcrR family transcriptional regulator [Deinococcus psychrotolerans]|uniref:TetR/AcrR family transcriptional regulator n=1 Tax=Deinococcus psychrotolerans TaxID=2489213 RepID=A0A3G8YCI2_9DEIO|nr:TetR/AcrR family transcriptional regulator [Deinococcus psychrotolerans]AZI43028.1 TetR/AcrR family transcriptional regulator [Deinococcus psychrotolerans]